MDLHPSVTRTWHELVVEGQSYKSYIVVETTMELDLTKNVSDIDDLVDSVSQAFANDPDASNIKFVPKKE